MARSRLLIAVSSPWASERLTQPIADISRRLDADVLVAHVAQLREEDEDESDAKQRGEQTLKLLVDSLREKKVEADAVMLFSDDIAKAILSTATARDCTLIVLGLTHKSRWQRLIAGDIPGSILRASPIPVLLCPADWTGAI